LILISSLLDPPGSSVGGRDVKGVSEVVAGGSEGFTEGVLLVVGLPGGSWGGVQAPPGLQGNLLLSWLGELEDASLFGNNCALVLGGKLGHQLGDKLANLLWVEVTMLPFVFIYEFRHIIREVALHISRRIVSRTHVTIILVSSVPKANLCGGLPYHLGEVTSILSESRLTKVIILYLVVPLLCSVLFIYFV